ncbi:TRAP transporter small permease [Bacillus salitolerans]|uniref:TRAP transporter small permease n=1 Tax=Bacillus salitolerans TaxID=1437434 RepID=A0ABW4LQV3_9BACI
MKVISDRIASFEKKLAMILMFAMAVIIALAVFFRYVINYPLFWAGEISIFLLIYITFIGGSLGLKYNSQASVTILTDYLPEKANKMIAISGHIFMLLFMTILLFYCFKWITSPNVALQKSSAILLPMWVPYCILPIGLSFSTLHILNNLSILIKGDDRQ